MSKKNKRSASMESNARANDQRGGNNRMASGANENAARRDKANRDPFAHSGERDDARAEAEHESSTSARQW